MSNELTRAEQTLGKCLQAEEAIEAKLETCDPGDYRVLCDDLRQAKKNTATALDAVSLLTL